MIEDREESTSVPFLRGILTRSLEGHTYGVSNLLLTPNRVDSPAHIMGSDNLEHFDDAGFNVNFYFGDMGGELPENTAHFFGAG